MKFSRHFLSAAALIAVLSTAPLTAVAEGRSITVSTEITPSYIVTIPTDTRIHFNVLDSDLGRIELTQARLEPKKCVRVTLLTDHLLENRDDAEKTLPFTVIEGSAGAADGQVFSSASYNAAGEKTDLMLHIEQNDWDNAFAGEYEDKVTFRIEYTDQSAK